MTNAYILTAFTALGIPAGMFAARHVMAKIALAHAVRSARPAIKKFKEDNINLSALSDEFRPAVSILRDYIHDSREKRDAEMADLRKQKIDRPQIELDVSTIGAAVVDNKKLFMDVMKNSYKHKIKHAFRTTVKQRLNASRVAAAAAAAAASTDAAAKTADAAGDAMGDAASHVADSVADTATHAADAAGAAIDQAYEKVKEHIEPHLDILEQKVMDIFDELGLIDFTVKVVETGKEEAKKIFGEHFTDHFMNIGDAVGKFDSIPFGMTSLRTLAREGGLLIKGETSFIDAAENAASTFALKAVGIKIGVALDVMTMGMSFGAFTVISSFAAGMIRNGILEEKNRQHIQRHEELFAELESAYNAAFAAIEEIATEFDTEFQRRVELYPDIDKEETLRLWIEELTKAFDTGLQRSSEQLTANVEDAISNLPENNWIDKVLFIDRREAVENLYLKAQREITSQQAGLTYNFAVASNTHAEDAVQFILDHPAFSTQAFADAFAKAGNVAIECEQHYEADVTSWRGEFNEFCEVEGAKATDKMNERASQYNDYKAAHVPEMDKLSKKIKNNRKRLGLKSGPAPAWPLKDWVYS